MGDNEAMESEEKRKWLDAMKDEMKSLHDNHTFDFGYLTFLWFQ